MTAKTKLGCAITFKDKAKIDRLTKKMKVSQGEVIAFLLENYEQSSNREPVLSLESFKLKASEQTEVENALTNSESELNVVARDGLLQRSRYLNSIASKQAQLDSMSKDELNAVTFAGGANFKIEQAVNQIIEHNNSQPEKSNKVCITKGMVFKLTGSNRQTINKWFDQHSTMICDHNQKHSLSNADNRKGKGFDWSGLLGV